MERLIFLGVICKFFHLFRIQAMGEAKIGSCNLQGMFSFRNSAVETVEQELLFVGSETGKLLAMRELVKKVYLDYLLDFGQNSSSYMTGGRLSPIPVSYLVI